MLRSTNAIRLAVALMLPMAVSPHQKQLYRPGDVLFRSRRPFVHALCADQRGHRCDHCFGLIDESVCCPSCKHVRYCGSKCREEASPMHQLECPLMRWRPVRPMTRLIVRVLAQGESGFEWILGHQRTWTGLMDHRDDIVRDQDAMWTFGAVVEEVDLLLAEAGAGPPEPSTQQLLSIYGKILINSFAVTEPETGRQIGRALYLGPSIFDHSCRPDLYFQFDGLQIYFVAARHIDLAASALTELHISYLDEMTPEPERQRILLAGYYFQCRCERCVEDQQDGWLGSTERLSQCLEKIEDFLHSESSYKLIELAIRYLSEGGGAVCGPVRKLVLSELCLPAEESHHPLSIRVQDWLACVQADPDQMVQLLGEYARYYGGRHHPRLLQRVLCWLGVLLAAGHSSSHAFRTLLLQARMARAFLAGNHSAESDE